MIDVHHQVGVRTDGTADKPDALDLLRGVKPLHRHLGFDLAVTLLDQRGRGAFELIGRRSARERAAGIGGHAIAQAAKQPRQRNAERLAADVPQRDIDRRYGQGRHPAGAARRGRGAKLGRYLLGTQRVFALDKFAELLKRRFQRAHDLAAERGDANAFDAIIGLDLNREEFAQHAGHRRRADQGLFQRKPNEIDPDLLNFHRVLECQSTRNLSRTA